MRVGIAVVLAIVLCAAPAPAVHAAEFNIAGSTIQLTDTVRTSTQTNEQVVKNVGPLESHTQTSTNPESIYFQFLGNRQLLSWQVNIVCKINGNFTSVSILYKVDGKNSGAVTCDGSTEGTDTESTTRLPTHVTYESETKIVGNEVHLTGTMIVKEERSNVKKGGLLAGKQHYVTTRVSKQSAVLELTGKTCRVRALSLTEQEIEEGDLLADNGIESTTKQVRDMTSAITDKTTCKIM